MDEQKKVFDNSYLEGLGMDELRLARAYKKASGARRAGYGKVLKYSIYKEQKKET